MPEYCVTGGSGFIATYLIKSLLENGHTVRTTVRDPGKHNTYIYVCVCVLGSIALPAWEMTHGKMGT